MPSSRTSANILLERALQRWILADRAKSSSIPWKNSMSPHFTSVQIISWWRPVDIRLMSLLWSCDCHSPIDMQTEWPLDRCDLVTSELWGCQPITPLSHCHTVTLPCNIGLTEALRSSQEIIRHPNKCNMDTIQAVSVYMVFPSVRQVPGLLINLFGNVSLVWGSHWHTGAMPRPTSLSCWSSENEKNESLEIIPPCLHSTWSDWAWSV